MLATLPSLLPCQYRNHASCIKNHNKYFHDRHGYHGALIALHFKNEAIKGEQELPLSPSLLSPFTLLEQAIHAIYPASKLMFFDTNGRLYKDAYFSYVCSKAISMKGMHLTANDVRHMFVTLWKDFVNSPTTKLLDITIHQACASAADLMLNSTTAWSMSYDDTNRSRHTSTTLSLWPQFKAFVEQAHLDATSQKGWNPLTTHIDELPS